MKHKIQQLVELQIQRSLKQIEKNNSIKYNLLLRFVDANILKCNSLKQEKKEDETIIITKKLIHLFDNVPDFLWRNKTISDMTRNFINICKEDNINTSTIDDSFMEKKIVSYMNTMN